MSSPPAEQGRTPDADWTPRSGAIYEPVVPLPSGTDAYTRHTDTWDRYLTRQRTDRIKINKMPIHQVGIA